MKNLRDTETNQPVNSLSLSVELEKDDVELSLEAERDFGDKIGKLTATIDDGKTVSAKIKLEFQI